LTLTEAYACCEDSQPTHIFVYDNKIFTICSEHFDSAAHRYGVSRIIDCETDKVLTPEQAFGEMEIGAMS